MPPTDADNTHKTAQSAPHVWWTAEREEAALLVAQDDLTDFAISERLNIGRRTLSEWKANPIFAARVAEHLVHIRDQIRKSGISIIENRIREQDRRWNRMRRLIEARAADPSAGNAVGGDTGLLRYDPKGGYEFDAALMREMRELEKHSAQELGQWTEKFETAEKVPVRIVFAEAPEAP